MRSLGEIKRYDLLPMLAERIFLVYYLFISALFIYHNDLGWHLAAGDIIRERGSIPKQDPWSYTAGDQLWINFSWGWDVVASWLHERFGMLGLQVVTACLGAAIIGLQTMQAVRMGASVVPIIVTVLIAGVALPQFSPPDVFLAITPQVVTLFFFALFHTLIWQALEDCRTHRLVYLPFLMLIWANMHGGFVLGFVLLGFYLINTMLHSRWHQMRPLLCCIAACLITATITPWGIYTFYYVVAFLTHPAQGGISEWQSVWERFSGGTDLPAVAYLLLFVPGLFGAVRAKRIPMPLFLISLILYVQAWFQIRYISLFIVFSIPLVAWGLSHVRRQYSEPANIRITRPYAFGLIALTLAMVSVLILKHIDRSADLPQVRWPHEEIAFIEKHYQERNLIHHWNYGSFIIYQAKGAIRPFIDGRAGTAYPLSLFKNFESLYLTGNWTQILKIYNITVVLWPKIDTKMLAFFRGNPQWKLVYEGELAVVYAKQ